MQQQKSPASANGTTRITITLILSMLLASLGTSIVNVALPTLTAAFSAPFTQVQAVVVSYLITQTIAAVVAGRMGDRYGLKPTLMAGLSVFSLASLLCGAATNLWLLVSARALQGIGAAFLMTLAMALTRQTATKARLGRAMGLLGTVSALGTALGPSLGGLLIALLGWRYIFWMQFPPAVIAFILASVTLPNDPDKGSGLSASLWSVLDQRLARHLVVNGLIAAIMMMTLVIGPFYLGLGLGLTAMQVGFVMAIGPMISIVSGVPSGRLVDAWGAGRVLDLGLTLLLIGAFLFAFLPNAIGVAGYVLSIIVLAPGYQLFQAANSTAALEDIPSNRQGAVSGLLTLSRNIGLIVGTSAMGTVFALSVGTQELAHASTLAIASGMRVTFLVASAMLVAAISISRGPRRA